MKKLLLFSTLIAGVTSGQVYYKQDINPSLILLPEVASGLTSVNTSITAESARLDSLVGDITQSYVTIVDAVVPYAGITNARPWYYTYVEVGAETNYYTMRYATDQWIFTLNSAGVDDDYTNPSNASIPPINGWSPDLDINFYMGQYTSTDTFTTFTNGIAAQALAGLYIHDGTNVMAITATNYTMVNCWMTDTPQSMADPINATVSTNGITVLSSGNYFVAQHISAAGPASATVESAVFVGTVHQDALEWDRKFPVGGVDIGDASAPQLLYLTSNQVVSVGVKATDAGDFIINQAQLVLHKVGLTVQELPIVQTLTGDETNASPTVAAVNRIFQPALGTNDILVLVGDSLTTSAAGKWGNILSNKYPNATFYIEATAGHTINAISTNVLAKLDGYFDSNKTCRVVLLSATVNDTTTDYLTFVSTYTNLMAQVIAAGWEASACEMYGWGTGTTAKNHIPKINRKIAEYANLYGYTYIPGVLQALNDPSTGVLRTNYWLTAGSDSHLNTAGQAVLAEVIDRHFIAGEKRNQNRPAYFENGKSVVSGQARFPDGSITLEDPSVFFSGTYAVQPLASTLATSANGYIGKRENTRVVGADANYTYVCYTNTYTNISIVATNQVLDIVTGANAGVFKILNISTVGTNDVPLTGCVAGDFLVACSPTSTVGVVTNIAVRQGRVLAKLTSATLSGGFLTTTVSGLSASGAFDALQWNAIVQRASGDIGLATNSFGLRSTTAGRMQVTNFISASSNMYIAVMCDYVTTFIGANDTFPTARIDFTTCGRNGAVTIRKATEVEE